jgi:hypothetical protein
MGMVVNAIGCEDKTSMDVWCAGMDKAIQGKAGKGGLPCPSLMLRIAGWDCRWGAR